jgi:hypothetical protein
MKITITGEGGEAPMIRERVEDFRQELEGRGMTVTSCEVDGETFYRFGPEGEPTQPAV